MVYISRVMLLSYIIYCYNIMEYERLGMLSENTLKDLIHLIIAVTLFWLNLHLAEYPSSGCCLIEHAPHAARLACEDMATSGSTERSKMNEISAA